MDLNPLVCRLYGILRMILASRKIPKLSCFQISDNCSYNGLPIFISILYTCKEKKKKKKVVSTTKKIQATV